MNIFKTTVAKLLGSWCLQDDVPRIAISFDPVLALAENSLGTFQTSGQCSHFRRNQNVQKISEDPKGPASIQLHQVASLLSLPAWLPLPPAQGFMASKRGFPFIEFWNWIVDYRIYTLYHFVLLKLRVGDPNFLVILIGETAVFRPPFF